jgi:hypothetical protein
VTTIPSTSFDRELVDAIGELQHDLDAHILGSDVGDLFSSDRREIVDPWYRSEHRVDRQCSRLVRRLRARRGGTRDRPAGRQDDDLAFVACACET